MAIPIFFILAILAVLGDAEYVLYNGEVLMSGQNLTNGPHQLAMQSDCDLVLYNNGKPTWRANIGHKGKNCYLGLKQTGELVVRRNVHYTLWSSNARSKKGKYALVLDGSGALSVLGTRRWSSNNQKEIGRPPAEGEHRPVVETEYVLHSGQRLTLGRKLVYREYELAFNRCNLVINNTMSGKTLWQTNTKSNGCYLQLENNGELALKHVNQRLWSSNKKSDNGVYIAVLRFDGRLAVYGPMLWSNVQNKTRSDYGHGQGQIIELPSVL